MRRRILLFCFPLLLLLVTEKNQPVTEFPAGWPAVAERNNAAAS